MTDRKRYKKERTLIKCKRKGCDKGFPPSDIFYPYCGPTCRDLDDPVLPVCEVCGDGHETENCGDAVPCKTCKKPIHVHGLWYPFCSKECNPAFKVDWRGDNTDLEKGGVKYDDGKPRFDLIAPEFEEGVAKVLAYGAKKYRDRNWEKGMRWGRCVAALRRHLAAWQQGEDIDPESALHHLDHAACCLMFLRAYVARQMGEDDRKRVFDE